MIHFFFSVIEESFFVSGESFICMSFRTRRFVRPDLYFGFLTVDSYVGLFVGTSNVVSVFVNNRVGFFVGIVPGAVTNELGKTSNWIWKRCSDEWIEGVT